MATNRIKIFDTTLRDGEQAPGCSMTLREKLRVAKALADLNVDIIEAGFPAASPGDFDSVKAIADENRGPVICGLARCNPDDIEKVHLATRGSDAAVFMSSLPRAPFTCSTSSRWPRKRSSRALLAPFDGARALR